MNKNSWTKQTNVNIFGTYLSSQQRTDSCGIRTKKAVDFLLLFYCEKDNVNNVFHANTSYSLISVKCRLQDERSSCLLSYWPVMRSSLPPHIINAKAINTF